SFRSTQGLPMKIDLDDPKLTAYALDELPEMEKAQIEAAVSASPEAQEFVRELRLLSGNLRAEYAAERETHVIASSNVVPLEENRRTMEPLSWLALAAAIAICAGVVAIAIGTMQRRDLGVASLTNSSGGERINLPPVTSTHAPQTTVEGIDQLEDK